MPPAAGNKVVRVDGLNELMRAFRVANREVAKDVRTAIEVSGEPIRQLASQLVRSEISGMQRSRLPWWTIRTGVERSTIGYIVPQQRGVKSHDPGNRRRRPNLAPLISAQEERARDANSDRIYDEFKDALDEVAKAWARV